MDESKTRDQRIAELLDGSGKDAVDSIKGPSLTDLTGKEELNTEAASGSEDEGSADKKIRIRSSRLKTLETELADLRGKASETETFKGRVAALEAQLKANSPDEELPEWWKEAYGDNDISKQGYKNQQRIMREELKRSLEEQEAQRQQDIARRNEQVQSIEHSFDEQMDELEDSIGRELTSTQKADLLDIVGEYSPMRDGKYTDYMSVSKAYEIWQNSQGGSASKREMANIAGIHSSGSNSSTSSERPQWGDWRKRFGV